MPFFNLNNSTKVTSLSDIIFSKENMNKQTLEIKEKVCKKLETSYYVDHDIKNVKDFYNKIIENNSKDLKCYLNPKDAKAGKEFIDKAETGKFQEKVQNAINILKWIEGLNKLHPIENVYWGYRAKPQGVMNNHPGDIFVQFKNKKFLFKAYFLKSIDMK